jgi:hypothetical protein
MTKLKYIAAGVLLFMVSFVGGCVGADAKTAEADEQDRFIRVERDLGSGLGNVYIYKDKETGVLYLVENSGYSSAICVMVDAEGKPLVDKE